MLRAEIDRDSPIPLYVQIVHELRARIGECKPGDKFYTDGELADVFHVSKITIRQAVQQLVNEGCLRRVRGIGTFVASPAVEQKLDQVRDFLDQWFFQNHTVRIQVHCFEERPSPSDVAGLLGIRPHEPVFYLQRVRYADNVPLVSDHRFFPPAIGQQLTEHDLQENTILRTVTEKLHIPVAGEQMEIWADQASPNEAKLLGLRRKEPVLVRSNTFYTPQREPLWTGRSYFRSDMYRYSIYVPVGGQRR